MARSKTIKLFLMDGEATGRIKCTLTADVLLSSPSAAAGFVGGASLSGNAQWHDANGVSLKQLGG